MAESDDETVKMVDSLISQDIQGEKDRSETPKSMALSEDELEKSNDSKTLSVDEQKVSETTMDSLDDKKIIKSNESKILSVDEQKISETTMDSLDDKEIIKNNESKTLSVDEQKVSETTMDSLGDKEIINKIIKHRESEEYSDDPERGRIIDFLRSKDISENLIGRVLKCGLSDGFDRLLQALGITNEELKKFEWKKRNDFNIGTYDSLETDETSMDRDELSMSPNNLYLKKYFGRILVRGMNEIMKRKPCDPVDFLGNWLINYKVCEERENKWKEFEADLNLRRKLLEIPEMDVESEIIDYHEKEESLENDFNYGECEEREM